jgi:hypothetical protein
MRKTQTIDEILKNVEPGWVQKHIQTATSLSKEPEKWLVDRFLLYGGVTMIAGAMGSQKSLLALLLAKAVSRALSGQPWMCDSKGLMVPGSNGAFLGRNILHGVPVLYVDRENSESEANKRIDKIGLLGTKNLIYWGEWNKEITPEPNDPRLLEFAHRSQGLIIFDSFQDWYGDRKEIDNSQMIELMSQFKRLARLGAGVLLIHHDAKPPAKGKTQGYRGGTGIPALTDMAISARKSAQEDGSIVMSEIRFRQCAPWTLTCHVDFRPDYYDLQLVSDQTPVDLYNARQAVAADKKAQRKTDKDVLVKAVTDDPTVNSRALEELSGLSRVTCLKVLADAGYTKDKAQGSRWVRSPYDDPAPGDKLPF